MTYILSDSLNVNNNNVGAIEGCCATFTSKYSNMKCNAFEIAGKIK